MKASKLISIVFFVFLIANFTVNAHIANDRKWLKHEYLSSLEGTILFVGVNYYNEDYYKYVKTPETFETIDLLPERSKFGSPYKHHVGDFLQFDPGYKYDHICLFGVMGQECDLSEEKAVTQALVNATKLLKIGGTLQVGPNKISMPQFNTAYWNRRLREYPLDKYSVILNTTGSCNMLWWGKKIRD